MPTSTPHFVRNKCSRLLKKVNQQLKTRAKISEFKFSNDSHHTRIKFLELIATLEIDLGIVAVMKDSVKDHLKENPNVLYNYLAVPYVAPVIVSNYLKSFMPVNRINFMIDRSLSKNARDRFNYYFDDTISYIKRRAEFKNDILPQISHENSQNDVCLQISDYVAGSVRAMTERNDRQYYEFINHRIKYRDKWDWHSRINW